MQPVRWAVTPSRTQAPQLWGSALSAGLFWDDGLLDLVGLHQATKAGSPALTLGRLGRSMAYNATGRNGDTYQLGHLAGALDGLAAITYWALVEFTGSVDAASDTIGLQWSGLQGPVEANARRVLFRYASSSDDLNFFTFTHAQVGGSFTGTSIGDGAPHLVCCRYDGAAMHVFVDGRKSPTSFAQSGALLAVATDKVPEVLGGHDVTSLVTTQSPRMNLYAWGIHNAALTDAQIALLARDPFAMVRPARRVIAVAAPPGSGLISEATAAAADWSAQAQVSTDWGEDAHASDAFQGIAQAAAGITEAIIAGDSDGQAATALGLVQALASADDTLIGAAQAAAALAAGAAAGEAWVGRVQAVASLIENAAAAEAIAAAATSALQVAITENTTASAAFVASVTALAELADTAAAMDGFGATSAAAPTGELAEHAAAADALTATVTALAAIGGSAAVGDSFSGALAGILAAISEGISADALITARATVRASLVAPAQAGATFLAELPGQGYLLAGAITITAALTGGVSIAPALTGSLEIKPN